MPLGKTASAGILTRRQPGLGCEHDPVAAARNCAANNFLGLPAGIDVGGVDEIMPEIEERMDHRPRLGLIARRIGSGSEVHRAETSPANHEVRAPMRLTRGHDAVKPPSTRSDCPVT